MSDISSHDAPSGALKVKPGQAYALLAITVFFWSAGVVIARAVHQEIPPLGLSFGRWLIAVLVLLPFCWGRISKNMDIVKGNLAYYAMEGFLMVGGGVLLFVGVNFTTATNSGLVNATQPVLTAGIAWILFRDRLNNIQLAGVLSALVGVSIMISRADLGVIRSLDFNIGDLITVVATIMYASYAVNLRRMPAGLGVFPSLAVILVFGTIFLTPAWLIEHYYYRPTPFTWELLGWSLVLAILISILSLAFWNTGNRVVGHNKAAVFVNLMPIYSAGLGIWLLGEQLFTYHIAGGVLVCAGIFMVVRKDKTAPVEH
jgi:drug/metabolite transporter (DMT)-like permease